MNSIDFNYYFQLGWHHIISWDALDHLYFIVALSVIYQLKHWKQVLMLVTAFTIGHATTLFLSALDIIQLKGEWVEFAIPCTIVLSCLANFRKKGIQGGADRLQYTMALFFGFVHGMGFANTIRFLLSKDQNMVGSLFGFNLGLEIGQIFVVLLVLIVGVVIGRTKFFNVREWVLTVSSLILGLALQLAIERFPF